MKKQTIVFSDKAEAMVEAFRRKQTIIPSFNSAVNAIIEQCGESLK